MPATSSKPSSHTMCCSYFASIQNKHKQIRPTDLAPILTRLDRDTGEIFEGFAWWTLIPSWAKDRSRSQSNFNARIETIAEKPSFREAFRERRCLVPAMGFHEWSGSKSNRIKHTIEVESSHGKIEPHVMAGIYEPWNEKALGGPPFLKRREMAISDHENAPTPMGSYAIVTTVANRYMDPIHDRMPVILNQMQQDAWMDTALPNEKVIAVVKAQETPLSITPPLLYM